MLLNYWMSLKTRMFGMLDPAQMGACFEPWLTLLVNRLDEDTLCTKTIAIDGKTLRGSVKAKGADAHHKRQDNDIDAVRLAERSGCEAFCESRPWPLGY